MTSSNKLWLTREMAEAHRAEGLGDGGGHFSFPWEKREVWNECFARVLSRQKGRKASLVYL